MNIVQLEAKQLICLRIVCEGDQYVHEIPKAAAILQSRLAEIKETVNPERFIGAYVVGDCPEEMDGYWIGVEVKQLNEIPEGMVGLTVPSRKYAVITHEGPNTEIKETYKVLHRWMKSQGYERDLLAWHLEISEAGSERIDLYDTIAD